MFENVDTRKTKISVQKKAGDIVVKKKRGRPKKPNMRRCEFKLDKVIFSKIDKRAQEQYTTKSAIVNQALAIYFAR